MGAKSAHTYAHIRKLCAAFCKFMAILHLKKKQQLTLGPWHATQNEKSKRSFCQAPFTVVAAAAVVLVVVVDAAVTVSAAALSVCV